MTRPEALELVIRGVKSLWSGDEVREIDVGVRSFETLSVSGLYQDVSGAVTILVDTKVEDYPLFMAKAAVSSKFNDVLVAETMKLVLNGGGDHDQ